MKVDDVQVADDVPALAFPSDGMLWRVCRERCNLLDGGAAAVLQVAHPKIAAGVRDHSDFRRGPVGRLQRTLKGVNTIAFGTRAEAAAMARRIAARHSKVRGEVTPGDASPASRYAADEQDLLLWVIATLVAAAVNGYERALPPLTLDEKERFHADMRRFGTYFGLPQDVGPQTWPAFLRYYETMLADPSIGSSDVSRAMAWAVAAPDRPWWLRLIARPARFAFSEVIPSPVRERLGFRSTPWSRFAIGLTNRLMPRIVPLLPSPLRYAPQYRRAMRRMRETAQAR